MSSKATNQHDKYVGEALDTEFMLPSPSFLIQVDLNLSLQTDTYAPKITVPKRKLASFWKSGKCSQDIVFNKRFCHTKEKAWLVSYWDQPLQKEMHGSETHVAILTKSTIKL